MLITLIVLAVLNLLVLGYIAWHMPKRERVVSRITVGDVATKQMVDLSSRAACAGFRPGTPW